MADHGWLERLRESDEALLERLGGRRRVHQVLDRLIGPIAGLRRATLAEDLTGVDYWADRSGGRSLGVDLKCREDDYDDLLIEFESNSATKSPGWTVDPKKVTDYVLYLWPSEEVLLPYPQLRAAAVTHIAEWRKTYREKSDPTTTNGGAYRTRWIPVPDRVVYAAMGLRVTGQGMRLMFESPPGETKPEPGTTCPDCGGRPLLSQENVLDPTYLTYTCAKRHTWMWRPAA